MTNSVSTSNTIFLCVGGDTNLLIAAGNEGSLAISPQAFLPVVQTNIDGTLVTNLANTISVVWNSLPTSTVNELTTAFAGIDQRMQDKPLVTSCRRIPIVSTGLKAHDQYALQFDPSFTVCISQSTSLILACLCSTGLICPQTLTNNQIELSKLWPKH